MKSPMLPNQIDTKNGKAVTSVYVISMQITVITGTVKVLWLYSLPVSGTPCLFVRGQMQTPNFINSLKPPTLNLLHTWLITSLYNLLTLKYVIFVFSWWEKKYKPLKNWVFFLGSMMFSFIKFLGSCLISVLSNFLMMFGSY